jgi:hypothetical protein
MLYRLLTPLAPSLQGTFVSKLLGSDRCLVLYIKKILQNQAVHSNVSMTAKLGVVNSQFYRFLRLCGCKKFFVFEMVNLIVFFNAKGHPLKVLLKRTRGCLLEKNSYLEFPLLAFSE